MSMLAGMSLWGCAWIGVSVAAGTPSRARLAPLIAWFLLPLPWLVAGPHAQRILLAFAVAMLSMSAVDFAAQRRPRALAGRLRYVIAFAALIDSTSAVRVPRRLDARAARHLATALGAGALLIGGWLAASDLPGIVRIPIRLIATGAMVLVAAELHAGLVRIMSAACGVHFATVHVHPYRSLTLADFWGRRWNLLGARWFRQHGFLPLRARGLTLALFSLFALSTAVHVYIIASAVPVRWMAMCAAFFLSQPLLLVAERRLRVRRLPHAPARAWTWTALMVLSPLLLMPLLAALGLEL